MAKKAKTAEDKVMHVTELEQGTAEICVVGTSPLIYNSLSFKAQQQLLLPRGRLTVADKQTNLKHDPLQEYRDSVYRVDDGPTVLAAPGRWFKSCVVEAAKRVPGATGAELKQLLRVNAEMISLYGVPALFMTMVRSSDMARTPDIRTRARVEQWAAKFSVTFIRPQITHDVIGKLLMSAGVICGIGDQRQQRGGDYGTFRLCNANDPEFVNILKSGGRAAQLKALDRPVMVDHETEKLYAWFVEETTRREKPTSSSGRVREVPAEALTKSKRLSARHANGVAN